LNVSDAVPAAQAAPAAPGDPHWIDGLATLSGLRDRDRLAVSLADVVQGLLQPREVQVWRVVGHEGDLRWLPQARLLLGQVAPGPAPATLEWHQLRAHTELPSWPETVTGRPGGADALPPAFFPFGPEGAPTGALLLRLPELLQPADQRLVNGVLRMYENVLGLLDYSERDELTGLLNRKTFDESFMRRTGSGLALRPAEAGAGGGERGDAGEGIDRRGHPSTQTWLGVIDIDHFKRVNDTYGHLIGDEVLLLVARLMRESFRLDDMLYRFGGEEFVALLRCSDTEQARVAFERMRCRVAEFAFPRVGHISVSIGFTEVRAGDTPSAAFERADRAVYYAKQNGRNQVQDQAALVAAGLLEDQQHEGGVELF
jgi:diguanylate cyclase (GGDEF)-like protein